MFARSISAGGTAGGPCSTVDDGCPVCDRNVTLNSNFTSSFCTQLPNPLTITSTGLCCPAAACEEYVCPTHCDTDPGAAFAQAIHRTQSSMQLDKYDCSRSPAARACAASIGHKGGEDCGCLTHDCYSSADLLSNQSSACILRCQDPSAAEICSDYDDENLWCGFYSVYHCVASFDSCDATKLQVSTCESSCLPPSKTVSLDSFLQCLDECQMPNTLAEREALAQRLEAR